MNDYAAVVLNSVAATSFTLDQQKTLQTYVNTNGHGLVTLGGLTSYALGGYADTLLASPRRWTDPRYALPLGYLAAASGDRRYRAAALDVASHLTIPALGKQLAIAGRTGFRLLAPLAAATPSPAAPPRPSAPAPRRPSPSRAAPRRPRGG